MCYPLPTPGQHQVKSQYFNHSSTGYSLRVGDFKLIVGNPGDSRVVAWPDPAAAAVPFGRSGGYVEPGEPDHCRAASNKKVESVDAGLGPELGLEGPLPCQLHPCLFNVVDDVSESNDLASNASYAGVLQKLLHRLDAAGATAPPTTLAYKFNSSEYTKQSALVCSNARVTNFIEPCDVPAAGP